MNSIFVIAANTLRDALRQKFVALMALSALALTFASTYIMKMDLGHEQLKFVANFTSGALGFFGGIIAITSVCQLFYSELENKTVATLLSKPVGFTEFVFGKLLGEAYMLLMFVVLIMLVGAGSLWFAQAKMNALPPEMFIGARLSVDWFGFAAFGVLQFLKLMAIASFATLICSLSRSMMFAIVISFMAVAASLMNYSDFMSGGGLLIKIVAYVLPNLSIFEPSLNFTFVGLDAVRFFAMASYAIMYILIFSFLSVWSFSRREI